MGGADAGAQPTRVMSLNLCTDVLVLHLAQREHIVSLSFVATDSPLPEDTAATRERFSRLDNALQPAFISRDAMSETKRGMLGYFYRERSYMR